MRELCSTSPHCAHFQLVKKFQTCSPFAQLKRYYISEYFRLMCTQRTHTHTHTEPPHVCIFERWKVIVYSKNWNSKHLVSIFACIARHQIITFTYHHFELQMCSVYVCVCVVLCCVWLRIFLSSPPPHLAREFSGGALWCSLFVCFLHRSTIKNNCTPSMEF